MGRNKIPPMEKIPRKKIVDRVCDLATTLDSQRKKYADIRVRAAASTLRKRFSKSDDGYFYCGEHRLVIVP